MTWLARLIALAALAILASCAAPACDHVPDGSRDGGIGGTGICDKPPPAV